MQCNALWATLLPKKIQTTKMKKQMKKTLLALTLQLLGMAALNAQEITGSVKDADGRSISGATISLLKAEDSSLVKLNLSKEGGFSFSGIANSSYLVNVSYVGHQTAYSAPFIYSGVTITLPPFALQADVKKLQSITVSAKKKLLEIKADRTILNIEGTINATGSDALELLRKSPGVTVDNDEKLSVQGKNGVQVYIDNKPTPLNGQDLSNYLKSLSATQIEAIEIIHNPGAMYEAAGSAGIINIRLKKNKMMGFSGSVTGGFSASQNLRWEDGFSLNYRNKKWNIYYNANANGGKTEGAFSLNRVIKDSAFRQQNKLLFDKHDNSYKTGVDYTINDRNSIGLTIYGNTSFPKITNNNTTVISDHHTGTVDKILVAENKTTQENNNINTNLNYLFKDSVGRTLIVNADYGYFNDTSGQYQPNTFYDASGKVELYRRNYKISSPTKINIYSLKADYEQSYANGKLAFGVKTGFVKTDNTFNQYNEAGNEWIWDKERSNFFRYKENVNAGYLSYSREVKGVALQAGVRAEQTNVEGTLKNYKQNGTGYIEQTSVFKNNYVDFFPSATITIAPKTANQFALSYSRRIDRPIYQDLNPFEYRINEYTYHKGSTAIRPQYSNTLSLTHTYKFKLNTALSYTHVKDVFGQLVDTAQGVKGYLVNSNIASQNITNLNISYPFQYKNYSLFTNVNGYYSQYKADYGAGRNLDLDVWAINVFAQNSLRFNKGWTAEVSGFYSSPSIWHGSLKSASIWSVDAGLQKQVLNGKGTIKASVSDLFKSLKWSANSNFAGQVVDAAGSSESRQFKLNFTYRFGKGNSKATRQVKPGLEEEINRTQSKDGLGH
jgi:hypothetical protein